MDPTQLPMLLALLIFLWLGILSFLLIRLTSHYTALTKNTDKKDLLSVLNALLAKSKLNESGLQALKEELKEQITQNRAHYQRFGFKRFNPFSHTGGDQSFILALLDENDNGFVISSLHSRENTRLYAKKIQSGSAPDQILSKEEKEVIASAKS